jgi:ribonuclease HI
MKHATLTERAAAIKAIRDTHTESRDLWEAIKELAPVVRSRNQVIFWEKVIEEAGLAQEYRAELEARRSG